MRIPFVSLIAASALALGGCAYGGIGLGYGDPYAGYYGSQYGGYGGYGYNSGYAGYGYNSGYGSPYGYGASYGYGSPYYGWYDGYYYPGTGYYVYNSYRQPVVWSDSQRRYWTDRQKTASTRGVTRVTSPNWSGFQRPARTTAVTPRDRMAQTRAAAEQRRVERRSDRAAARSQRATTRTERARARTSDSDDDRRTRRRQD